MKINERWTKEQVKLWEKVRDAILAEPEAYEQSNPYYEIIFKEKGKPNCDSPVCILGWVSYFTKRRAAHRLSDKKNAEIFLGLTGKESEYIFFHDGCMWKESFSKRFRKAKTPKGRARIAASYINDILKTGEV